MSCRAPIAIYYDMAEGDSTSSTRQSEPALKLILLRELVRGRDRPLHSRPISTKARCPLPVLVLVWTSQRPARPSYLISGEIILSAVMRSYQSHDHYLIRYTAILSRALIEIILSLPGYLIYRRRHILSQQYSETLILSYLTPRGAILSGTEPSYHRQ